jgi:Flp pilus assembly protein TadD
MAGVLHVSSEDEATGKRRSEIANSFVAKVYFNQAISLLKRGVYAEAESSFREVLKIWPDHASSLNNLGTAVWRLGRLHEAENYYRRARALKPDDFAILNNLGNVLWDQGRLERALRWYRQAVRLKPDSPEALMNLGVVLSDLGEFEEALYYTRESLRLAPDSPDSHVNLGMTLARLGKRDEALKSYERALSLNPELPEAHRNRAYIWLARGDFERGWPEYEWRLRCKKLVTLKVDSPRWNGEPLKGRSILLYAEQGLGDVLQFIRFATVVKERGGRVIVACAEPLLRLVAGCPGVDRVVDWKSPLPASDLSASLLSLPNILGTTLATLPALVPYLSADAATIDTWQPALARALGYQAGESESGAERSRGPFKIGIAWQGNRLNKVDRWRSFPLVHFEHLAAVPGVRLISLQKGDGTEQLADVAGQFPVAELVGNKRPDEDRRDFLDTAAVMSQLDLVVTPETAVAHLAGSLGVKTWVPLSKVGDWRWMIDRDDSPWYPTIRLFRQTNAGDWDGVFRRMAQCLRQELGT